MKNIDKSEKKPAFSTRLEPAIQSWLEEVFENRSAGAENVIMTFYTLYRMTLVELHGRFSRPEINTMLDVQNGCWITPHAAGMHLIANVADGCALNDADKHHGADGKVLLDKLQKLSRWHLTVLEVWCVQMWAHNEDAEYWPREIARMAGGV